MDTSDKSDKADKAEKTERSDKAEKTDKSDKSDKAKKKIHFRNVVEFDLWIRSYLAQKRSSGPVIFLDSQLVGHVSSQSGYIASDPVMEIRASAGEGAWDLLKKTRKNSKNWLFGWLSYDLKNETEALVSRNPDPVGLPDLYFFEPGVLLKTDRKSCTVSVIKGGLNDPGLAGADTVRKSGNTDAYAAASRSLPGEGQTGGGKPDEYAVSAGIPPDDLHTGGGYLSHVHRILIHKPEGLQHQYARKVLAVKDQIVRGDTYEVNLTLQLHGSFEGDSLDLFEEMRKTGPVPFGAWLSYGDIRVCCASPERFLKRDGNRVVSQPIKGTSPRGNDPGEDARIIREILNKEKNRSENVMIVDLVRNDLGRIAKTGTVCAESLLEVQTFSTVHHLVSTISAVVPSKTVSVDILKACFPMGSMTGAPKIRTMEIIDELEDYRRNLYSGAIGYFTPKDDFDFNVVIRTAIIRSGMLYYAVGGAITSDSVPLDEWDEIGHKVRALGCSL